jgi:hypothetical protein
VITIRHKTTKEVIFEGEYASTKECVLAAIKAKASLAYADLSYVDLSHSDLSYVDLSHSDLSYAYLSHAILTDADLSYSDLSYSDLSYSDLSNAYLSHADLADVKGLVKIMNVKPGNIYWKRFDEGLNNNGYQFKIGINKLREGEVFASDERVLCSYPGFHFASREWCNSNYGDRPLEAKIRIPENALINEPWATDGKASSNMIEILQVFDVRTKEDVTEQYR